jgi:hypothetical protein
MALLAAVTLIASAIALLRIASLDKRAVASPSAAGDVDPSTDEMISAGGSVRDQPRFPFRSVVLLTVAAGLAVGAVLSSQLSMDRSSPERFAELWLVPDPGAPARAELGFHNDEGRRTVFEVRVSSDGKLVGRWNVGLASGGTWTRYLTRRSDLPISATLSIASPPDEVLDSVDLAAQSSVGGS